MRVGVPGPETWTPTSMGCQCITDYLPQTMRFPPTFHIGDPVWVSTPRTSCFRRRAANEDRVRGIIVGREEGGLERGGFRQWWYRVKLNWDEPWVLASQTDLLRLNPRSDVEST